MEDISVSDIVLSLAGHDKGKLYIVISVKDGYASLVDGRIKKLANPKRKRLKHIALAEAGSSASVGAISAAQDSKIRTALVIARDSQSDQGGKCKLGKR